MALSAFAAERRHLLQAPRAAIDRYLLPVERSAAAAVDRSMGSFWLCVLFAALRECHITLIGLAVTLEIYLFPVQTYGRRRSTIS